jgi:DNA-binding MarR family transcriptional regulator
LAASLWMEDQFLVALRRITRAIDLRSRLLLQRCGLTIPQLIVLQTIRRLQPVSAGDVAAEVHLGGATVTGIFDRLQRRELIQRVRGHRDRRSVEITLTEAGRRMLEQAPSVLQDEFQRHLLQLATWEQTQILATLQRVADMMDIPEPPDSAGPNGTIPAISGEAAATGPENRVENVFHEPP